MKDSQSFKEIKLFDYKNPSKMYEGKGKNSFRNLKSQSIPRKTESKVKLGYRTIYKWKTHHLINSMGPKIEPNAIPDKLHEHHMICDFSKNMKERDFLSRCLSPNENRFENINKAPSILSNIKHVGDYNMNKTSSRRALWRSTEVTFGYNPNDKITYQNNIYCNFQIKIALKFKNITGRTIANSIYRNSVPSESDSEYEEIIQPNNLYKLKSIYMNLMIPRDDKMYRQSELYNPRELDDRLIVKRILENELYEKALRNFKFKA